MSGPDLLERALDAAVQQVAAGVLGERALEATRGLLRAEVEAAMREVLRLRFELVEHLRDTVEERLATTAAQDDARFLDGVEFGLARSALQLGVDAAASPQRLTELPRWLEAHAAEGIE